MTTMKTSATVYCYHCQTQHAREDMRLTVTKTGKRWRCAQSIAAVKGSMGAREAFGRKVSANNKAEAQAKLRMMMPLEKSIMGR